VRPSGPSTLSSSGAGSAEAFGKGTRRRAPTAYGTEREGCTESRGETLGGLPGERQEQEGQQGQGEETCDTKLLPPRQRGEDGMMHNCQSFGGRM
jgi:hypothetical protein